MGQVRINELGRELEIKSRLILNYLPEAGVTEKKSHSSSIEDEVADKLRAHFRAYQPAEEHAAWSEDDEYVGAVHTSRYVTSDPSSAMMRVRSN